MDGIPPMNGIPAIMATVALAGFAIQQLLQLFEPAVTLAVKAFVPLAGNSTPLISEGDVRDAKKWAMALLAFLLGLLTVLVANISLLAYVKNTWEGTWADIVVSALVLGAGTEGLNTMTKYFGYVKESRKQSIKAIT